MLVFCILKLWWFVGSYKRFEETHCLHFQGWIWRQCVNPKSWYLPTSPQYVTAENNMQEIQISFTKDLWYITLMMEVGTVSETLYCNSILKRLVAQEDFITLIMKFTEDELRRLIEYIHNYKQFLKCYKCTTCFLKKPNKHQVLWVITL